MRVVIEDQEHWHALRSQCIGASDVANLFGCGYKSLFQYWHEKHGELAPEDFTDNERVILGRHLEDGIASAAGELYGYKLAKARAHYTDDVTGGLLGATPDYFMDIEDSDTVVEVKNASWGAFKDDWIIHEDGFVECPLRFQLQVQAQLACTGAANGILIALISGDRIVRCFQPRHETAIAAIRDKVMDFHSSLEENREPPADMPQDYDAAKRVWVGGPGQADMRGDTRIETWLASMGELRQTAKAVEADIKKIQGEVLAYCTSNGLASITADGGRISCKWRDPKPEHDKHFKAQPGHHELRITVP